MRDVKEFATVLCGEFTVSFRDVQRYRCRCTIQLVANLTAGNDQLRERCKALPDPKPLDMFAHVYAEETEELRRQREGYAAYLETFEEARG